MSARAWEGEPDARRCAALLFDEPGRVVELRALDVTRVRGGIVSGYCDSPDALIEAAAKVERRSPAGVYITMNPIRPELHARAANVLVDAPKHTTADTDVTRRRLLLVDLDPVRASGISSTNDEHEAAIARAREVAATLSARRWPRPLLASSGNGAHAYYAIDLPAQDGGLVRRVLEGLAAMVNDEHVTVDTTVHNPARIARLPGTLARKGSDTQQRPHRRAALLDVPQAFLVVSRELLEAMAVPDRKPTGSVGVTGRTRPDRGDDVTGRARAYLAKVPGAVAGNGGDATTYRVACALVRDFALDDAGALDLFREWNLTCSPPWEDRDLEAKLAHARKYGKGTTGSKADAPARTKAARLRPAPRADGEPGDGAPTLPTIIVRPASEGASETVDALEQALLARPGGAGLYERAGLLVRVLRQGRQKGRVVRAPDAPIIAPAPIAWVFELAASSARWLKAPKDEDAEPSPTFPPRWAVEALLARGEWLFPQLVAVVEAPVLRTDGSILDTPGYDPATGLLFEAREGFPPIPTEPSVDEARAALAVLAGVLDDFPFLARSDRAAALAYVLTIFARHATGPAPLFAIRAPTPGSGKSLLADVASVIATGRAAARMAQAKDDEEEAKVIIALGMEGAASVLIDNIERPLGSSALAAVLTAGRYQGRLLGENRTVTVPVSATWAATGNNLVVRGDLGRRVVPIDLDPACERPEARTGFRHADLLAHVRAERPRLVAAALTILRAFHVSDGETPDLEPFGSFDGWSRTVRSALVWLGEADPCAGRERIRRDSDPAIEALRTILASWRRAFAGMPKTIAEAIAEAGRQPELRAALAGLDSKLDPDRLDPRRLGYAFRKHRGRIVGGMRLEGEAVREAVRWSAVMVADHPPHHRTIAASEEPTTSDFTGDCGDSGDDSDPTRSAHIHACAHAHDGGRKVSPRITASPQPEGAPA